MLFLCVVFGELHSPDSVQVAERPSIFDASAKRLCQLALLLILRGKLGGDDVIMVTRTENHNQLSYDELGIVDKAIGL